MAERNLVQCRLRRGDSVLMAWLPTDKKFRVGNQITLKGDPSGDLWTVETIGAKRDADSVNRGWNVGGI